MAIFNDTQYTNRYDAGQQAVNRGDWRMAFDCFKDCKEYLEYDEPWREEEIEHLGYLIRQCQKMF